MRINVRMTRFLSQVSYVHYFNFFIPNPKLLAALNFKLIKLKKTLGLKPADFKLDLNFLFHKNYFLKDIKLLHNFITE